MAQERGNVAFYMYSEFGHIDATTCLASSLKSVGFTVFYWAKVAVKEQVERLGFSHVEDRVDEENPEHSAEEKVEARIKIMNEMLQLLQLSLLIVDVYQPMLIWAVSLKAGVPTVCCSTTFSPSYQPGLPPCHFNEFPSKNVQDVNDLHEKWLAWKNDCSQFYNNALDTAISLKAVANMGISPFHVFLFESSVGSVHVKFEPQLIMCSKLLDYPEFRDLPFRHYCSSASKFLSEPRLDASPQKPLVVVSFGSQAKRYPRIKSIVKALLQVFERHTELQCIAAVEDFIEEGYNVPLNTRVQRWIDQKQILTSASAFLFHGGLGSMKEAVWFKVPMIAIPMAFDQFGNASRIVYHRIGVRLDAETISVDELEGAILQVVFEKSYKDNVSSMSEALSSEEMDTGLAFCLDKIQSLNQCQYFRSNHFHRTNSSDCK